MEVCKKATVMVLAVVLASVPLFGCAVIFNPNTLSPEIQLATVKRGDLIVDISASGNLTFSKKADLAFNTSGTVEKVSVEEGYSVKKGQVLARLDASELERNLIQAKINLKRARLNLEDAKYGKTGQVRGARPQPDPLEIEIKELEVKLAEAQLEEAKKATPLIIAPFDGLITKVHVSSGSSVKKGAVAVSLVDPTQFEVEILVNEMDIFKLKQGGEATIQVNAMPTIILPAKVKSISPTATIQMGVVNYKVKLELVHHPQIAPKHASPAQSAFLREGLTLTVSIPVEKRENVLLVPNRAITRRGGDTFVQVIKDGVVTETMIKTGINNWQWTEVVSGLNEGDKVVIPRAAPTQPIPLIR